MNSFSSEILVEGESRGGRRQKKSSDAVAKLLRMAKNHLICLALQFPQYPQSDELKIDTKSGSIEARENFVFIVPRTAAKTTALLSLSKLVGPLQLDSLSPLVSKALGDIHDCYIAELGKGFKFSILLVPTS